MWQYLGLVCRAWRYRLKVEREEIGFVLRHLRPGDTAVDIGAHKGAFTYWMRRKVGSQGSVLAFEPQPVLAARLRSLTRSWPNVVVENMGLSSRSGTLSLRMPAGGPSPVATLEPRRMTAGMLEIPVPVTTLDDYLAGTTKPWRRINLIKCDVEGHELEVFRGAERTLRKHRPILLFERETRHCGGQPIALAFDYLTELGYRGYFPVGSNLHDIAEFDPARHQKEALSGAYVNNFIFMPDSVPELALAAA